MSLDWESQYRYVAYAALLALAGSSLLLVPQRSPAPPAVPPPPPAPPTAPAPPDELRRLVSAANRARAVRHVGRYGPVLPDTVLLVVRARDDAAALARLLRSLSHVPDVRRALLVVSHARYDAVVEREVRAVDFCRVLQVYYPHSAQLHPDGFPGPEPAEEAGGVGGVGGAGSAREPARVERKQHWWWTADLVFERLEWSRAHCGPALFLEDDDVVEPDLLHVLGVLRRAAADYFPRAALLALGGRGGCGAAADALLLRQWGPALAAPVFDRVAWRRLTQLASFYCIHDDASWSRSLQHALAQLPPQDALVLVPAAPRVLSSHSGRTLRPHELFPARMRARLWLGWPGSAPGMRGSPPPPPRAGQFADLRDQMMCLDSYMPTTPEDDEAAATTLPADSHLIEVI